MSTSLRTEPRPVAELTVDVVNVFLHNNQIEVAEVGDLIRNVAQAFQDISNGHHEDDAKPIKVVDHSEPQVFPPHTSRSAYSNGQHLLDTTRQRPAVPIAQSVTPDWIICLEDGRKFKTMKHHLRKTYDMSPEEYRAKWGLPPDYPITAPNHSKNRREIAKGFGLGSKIRS